MKHRTNEPTDDRAIERTALAKPIVGILALRTELLDEILSALAAHFGPPDIVGDWRPFSHTDYYEPEMGPRLSRCFVAFERLVPAWEAARFKAWTAAIEERFRREGKRAVNLDPGTLDVNKVVLISGKHGGHKIALAGDVYADLLLWYNKGWVALPWAFPDFRDGSLFPLFSAMRTALKAQLKALSRGLSGRP